MMHALHRYRWHPPRSLRVRLLWFLLGAVLLSAALQGALSYRSALAEADVLFDYISSLLRTEIQNHILSIGLTRLHELMMSITNPKISAFICNVLTIPF